MPKVIKLGLRFLLSVLIKASRTTCNNVSISFNLRAETYPRHHILWMFFDEFM